MLNLDPAKLLIIAVVAVILLGPDRLPQVARQVGGFWRTFTEYRHRMESQVREAMPDLPSSAEIARLTRSPSALLDHLSTMGAESEKETDPLASLPDGSLPEQARTQAPHAAPRPGAAPTQSLSPEPAPSADPGLN